MSTSAQNDKEKPEESLKTIEDLANEIKNLKTQINSFKEDIALLKVDKQMKDFKISILEQRIGMQDEQIRTLKAALDNKNQNKEEAENKKGEESQNKKEDQKGESSKNNENKKKEENNIIIPEDGRMNIVFKKNLTNEALKFCSSPQMFSAFKTLKGGSLLIWVTKKKTIELYDLDKEEHVKTIKDAHSNDIQCCRHFVDTKKNEDLLITSSYDKSLKLWNVEKMDEPLLTIENAHDNGFIFTPCILSHEKLNENYIISGADEEGIKIFDFNGKFLEKKIKMEEYINFLDTYYDKKSSKFYILNGNSKSVKVFNFDDLSLYKIYKQKDPSSHPQIIIYEDEKNNKTQLIESDMRGLIHIWDFHTAELIKDIPLKTVVNGICLWDEQYLITTGKDKLIKIVDMQKNEIIRTLSEHQVETIAVQKITLSKYGECILSHGKDGVIKLWSLNK